ncbi:DUF2812 domain-containing protein [Oceanobacillus neutriphilus]|uniref:DUF2812 domain-containing protein n=1 Tax=Oceanobacillus neutriphilus TaxID=531815 RepID=A0ABQ2NST6_9BACI|nr:DUF2812 domain-containing protein [Oceanobacillus neutriphilus]GGP09789.1 hypothetical protein GCM10011346_15300 [Oceanobacillus neutriphilus]
MRQTKYMMSDGLAFSEEKDMEKLRRLSLKGWHVCDFKFMGYILEKGESSDYIYNLDYRSLEEGEEEEYFDLFLSSGWSHVASEAGIHLFRAEPGTKSIYSDLDTTAEKYKSSSDPMIKMAISLFFITALLWGGAIMSSGVLHSILFTAAVIFSVLVAIIAWTAIAQYSNKWKTEGKHRLASLGKMTLPLLLLIAVIIMFFVIETGYAIRILASMIIGGIALPIIIRGIISLHHIISKKTEENKR